MRAGRIVAGAVFVLMGNSCKQRLEQVAPQSDARQPAKAMPKPAVKAHATALRSKLGTLPEGIGLPVGSQVADVEVKTHLGTSIRLAKLVKAGPLLLIFYRGGW